MMTPDVKVAGLSTPEIVELSDSLMQELARRAGIAPQKKLLRYQPCPKCAQPIAWVRTESGAKAALEDNPGPYIIADGIAKWAGAAGDYAYHFETCPKNDPPQTPPRQSEFDRLRPTDDSARDAEVDELKGMAALSQPPSGDWTPNTAT